MILIWLWWQLVWIRGFYWTLACIWIGDPSKYMKMLLFTMAGQINKQIDIQEDSQIDTEVMHISIWFAASSPQIAIIAQIPEAVEGFKSAAEIQLQHYDAIDYKQTHMDEQITRHAARVGGGQVLSHMNVYFMYIRPFVRSSVPP